MLKSRGIIHAQLRRALARIGYNSQIGIVDAGYNIPIGVEVIDLALCRIYLPCFRCWKAS